MADSSKHAPHTGNELLDLLTTMQATSTKSPSTTPLTSDGELIQRIYRDIERSIKEKDHARRPLPAEAPRPGETHPRALH